MISKNTRRVPATLYLVIVAVATCILPLGFVGAQDFEALERRLGGAVEKGEITRGDAEQRITFLRNEIFKQDASKDHDE